MPEWLVGLLGDSPFLGLLLLMGWFFWKRESAQQVREDARETRFEKILDSIMNRFADQDKRSTDAIIQNSNVIGQNSALMKETKDALDHVRKKAV